MPVKVEHACLQAKCSEYEHRCRTCVDSIMSNYTLTCICPTGSTFTGSVPGDSVLEGMVKEAPGSQLNFTAFLSIFSDKLSGEY